MVRQSIITLALLQEVVYEFRGNKTCIIQDRTALSRRQRNSANLKTYVKSYRLVHNIDYILTSKWPRCHTCPDLDSNLVSFALLT